jgi:uncharacterized membrane protein HdeD (DUF308 family)
MKKKTGFLISAIYIVFGLLLLIFPDTMKNLICILLGIAALAIGIIKLIIYFRKNRLEAALAYDMALGIIFVILGIIILIFQGKVLEILPVVFGIFILISSLMKIQTAADIRRLGGTKWWLVLIFAIVSVIFSVILILRPEFMVNASFIIIGIFMVIDGIGGAAGALMYEGIHKKTNAS